MSSLPIKEKAYAAIREGNIEGALDLLRTWMKETQSPDMLKLDYLSSRWKRIEMDSRIGTIRGTQKYQEENKVIWDLLKLVEELRF